METKTAKLFMNGQSQAVRLPKEFRFTDIEEVFIKKVGDTLVLSAKKAGWNDFFNSLSEFSDDFMNERNQPAVQEREELF